MTFQNPVFFLASWIILLLLMVQILEWGKMYRENSRKVLITFVLFLILPFLLPFSTVEKVYMVSLTLSFPIALWYHQSEKNWKDY